MNFQEIAINRRQFINRASKIAGFGLAASVLGPRLLQAAPTPAIFYSPHADDEAIGMAGAMQEQKAAGRPVYLVLLTDGVNPALLDIMNGATRCKWHRTHHRFNLTMEQMMWARKIEFIASARQLQVDKLFILNDGRGWDDREPYTDYNGFVSRIIGAIKHFEQQFPGAAHRLASGFLDASPEGGRNPTHRACWDAALMLRPNIADFRFYRVYVYYAEPAKRQAQSRLRLKNSWQAVKQRSLAEYQLFIPAANRYALGYHSVPKLMDNAAGDIYEYFDLLP